jgi:hypothetical protein
MPEDLEAFLGKKKPVKENFPEINGSFACQECPEILTEALLDEDNRIIIWYCSENHRSQVSL